MLKLVRRARSRLFRNELLAAGMNVVIAALAAAILLLVAGASMLDWRVALTAPALVLAGGAYRAYSKLPKLYRVAQIVDSRLRLADTLSTAIHISEIAESPEGFQRLQIERAERLAGAVDLRRAIPYRMPRGAYAALALFLVASSLVALRFAADRTLEIKKPLARVFRLDAGSGAATLEAKNEHRDNQQEPASKEQNSAEGDSRQQGEKRPASEHQTPPADQRTESARGDSAGRAESQSEQGQQKEAQQNQAENQAEKDSQGEGENRQSSSERQENRENQASRQQNGSGGNGLMSRVKDAVRNLMAKLNPGQAGQQQNQQQAQSNGNKQNSQSAKGSPQDSRPSDATGRGSGEKGEQERSAQSSPGNASKGGGKPDGDEQSEPGNGIGNKDGSKEIKEAEQLAAMGKISEILGKRAAEITGESTVEVDSGVQQLQTPYGQRGAKASAGGAEIGRDEVPIALQGYVQQYFEQVRKTPRK